MVTSGVKVFFPSRRGLSSSRTTDVWSAPHSLQVLIEPLRVNFSPQSHSTTMQPGHHL